MEEKVVLVNEQNQVLGEMLKSKVHTLNTPLHRGFSCFWFNSKQQLLLQQRSRFKKTWPLTWSNSCCGHPALNEENEDAVKRRLSFELNLTPKKNLKISDYRYSFVKDGIMENEICPIFVAFGEQDPILNPQEVENIKWVNWSDFLEEVKLEPKKYSPWCVQEAQILGNSPKFLKFLESLI